MLRYAPRLRCIVHISVNRHLPQVRAVSLRRELFHLLVNEVFFFLRDPEFHLYVPLSVRHKTPPFFIRVWDYPNKQKSASGYSLAVLAIVTLSYLLALPLLHLGRGKMADFSQKGQKRKTQQTLKICCAVV